MDSDPTPAAPRQPPQAAQPRRRGRNAEQTQERILAAALEEFGAKGYAGARTAGIAQRAGVNPQLISYYFGGKQGLLGELRRRWATTQAALVPAEATFAESLAAYLDATLDRPDWAKLVVWRALGDDPGESDDAAAAQRARLQEGVARIRRRQRRGELTGNVDAEFVLLLAYALAFAPIAMPHVVEGIFGVPAASSAYRRRCLQQLVTLLDPGSASPAHHSDHSDHSDHNDHE